MSARRLSDTVLLAALWLAVLAPPSARAVNIRIDYSTDSSDFFDDGTTEGQHARAIVEAAAGFFSDVLGDELTAETASTAQLPSGGGARMAISFQAPGDLENEENVVRRYGFHLAEDEYVVFVGADEIAGPTLAVGAPGGFYARSTGPVDEDEFQAAFDAFVEDFTTRGQPWGFAHWGGAMTFDLEPSVNWNLEHTQTPPPGTRDLYSVALHELAHVLGFSRGTFEDLGLLNAAGRFTGANARAEYGAAVPLDSTRSHWAEGAQSTVYGGAAAQEALLDPNYNGSSRKLLTELDAAGLADIGWTLLDPPNLPGDFNLDGVVDAADYAAWRDGLGASYVAADYQLWRQHFGATLAPIAGSEAAPAPAPEPTSGAALLAGCAAAVFRRRR